MEDYNTATMPHHKFYNYEKWEMEEYVRQQDQARQKQSQSERMPSILSDEEERRRERKKAKEDQERKEFEALRSRMLGDKDKREDMKKQAELQLELQQAFKRGDTATVKKLERLLAPDEEKPVARHPWASR